MGTNYYAETKACVNGCDHCGQVQSLHICKSLISFQGHLRGEWEDSPEPRLGEIRSWADWKTALRSGEVTCVRDEYGREHGIEAFIADVEATDREARGRQYRWMVDHYAAKDRPDDWLDADGFSFCSREFS